MASLFMLRGVCQWDEVGSERLAGESLTGENSHQSPTPTVRAVRRCWREVIATEHLPRDVLDSIWRIRSRGLVGLLMIDRVLMARLWTSIRSAVHEFKISRMQKRSDSRFRVVVRKYERRRSSSSRKCRPPSCSTRCKELKWSVRRRAGQAATVVGCPGGITNALGGFSPLGRGKENENGREEDSSTEEIKPINWARWNDIDIGEFSPRAEIAIFSSSRSMEEFGSLKWEESFLTTTASARSEIQLGESSSIASSTGAEKRRWAYRYRLSNKSPHLLQPVRGKLATLSSLLRTMSDRYARRTGKLTSLHDRPNNTDKNNNNSRRPVLTPSQSAPMQYQNHHSSNSIVDDVPVKRYDNPFQDFLRQSFAERNSRSIYETDRQR